MIITCLKTFRFPYGSVLVTRYKMPSLSKGWYLVTVVLTGHFSSHPNDVEQLKKVENDRNGKNTPINCVLGLV